LTQQKGFTDDIE